MDTDDKKYSTRDLHRFLKFYQSQGVTLDDVIQILEYDGGIPTVQNKPQPV